MRMFFRYLDSTGIRRWTGVLQSFLPSIIQSLPHCSVHSILPHLYLPHSSFVFSAFSLQQYNDCVFFYPHNGPSVLQSPLPIRILVPILFNAIRLGPLMNWASLPMGWAGKTLAGLNLAYWSVNLFGYLLPVAAIRYMRAHFFCVEAEQVVTRPGLETSAGLMG